MYVLRATALVTALIRLLEVSESMQCHFSRNMKFPQNVSVSLNISGISNNYGMEDRIHLRSLSPWNYRMDKDENRFPAVIAEAVCRHSSCLDAEGVEDPKLSSVPIMQELLVIRRETRGCQQTFRLHRQWVSVGCTCIRPVIRDSA
ncbi:interleukin-17A-like isoform X2 [Pseudophryne corroboree]|uniref:interleukin-17A-like isoform X2 n=1 Tax=Pseudophryne corroboree TaxID=495146 RepID=UPI003081BCE6